MQNRIKELMEKVGGFKPATLAEIEDFRIKILGKKGELTALFEEFKSLSAEQKKEIGKTINELKTKALDKINELKESLDTVVASDCDAIDMSRPATARRVGTRHPISLVRTDRGYLLTSGLHRSGRSRDRGRLACILGS